MSRSTLRAEDLAAVMETLSKALLAHRDTINRLNVYPVPDGDTGTNMQLTLASVTSELAELEDLSDMKAVTKAVSHGSLMGARGNSGVILCQVLRAIAESFAASLPGVGPKELAGSFEAANEAARAGVMRPVEGTILTVAAEAAAASREAADGGGELAEVVRRACEAAVSSLGRTPELLSVLAKAGVVDAGGAGLVLLFDSFAERVSQTKVPDELPLPDAVRHNLASSGREQQSGADAEVELAAAHEEGGSDELRYEVMYFLETSDDSALPAFKEVWAGIGDSIVVVGGEGLWNCHIHTNDIGESIEAALDVGRPFKIRVTDLAEQVEEESWVQKATGLAPGTDETAQPAPTTSVIAVATGEGIRRIFHSLGVRDIVAGGQSMNPSTAQILEMIEAAPGSEVVLLPNNKNIHAVAAQAAAVSKKPALIVPTEGIQEGFAALLEYDPEASAEENAAAMTTASARVVAGEVTKAVRAERERGGLGRAGRLDRPRPGRNRREGERPSRGGLSPLGQARLCSPRDRDDHRGLRARPADTRRITEWLAEHRPAVSCELHQGGQPLYPYLLATE